MVHAIDSSTAVSKGTKALIACLMAISILSAGSGAASATETCAAAVTDDPFAYCARIGSIDKPNGGNSPVPPALLPYLRPTLGLSSEAPLTPETFYWRCMDRAVYICATGANIRCDIKADRAKRNSGADSYCRENRDAVFVPAYASGHDTIYEWSCAAGLAVRGKRTSQTDHRAYRTDIWHRVSRRRELPMRSCRSTKSTIVASAAVAPVCAPSRRASIISRMATPNGWQGSPA
jgi:hypothetical protein